MAPNKLSIQAHTIDLRAGVAALVIKGDVLGENVEELRGLIPSNIIILAIGNESLDSVLVLHEAEMNRIGWYKKEVSE